MLYKIQESFGVVKFTKKGIELDSSFYDSYKNILKICTDDEFLKNKGSVGEDIYDKGYYLKDVLLYVSESKMESIDDKTKIANEMTKFLYNDLSLNPRTAKSLIDNYEKNEYNSEKIVSCLMQEKEGDAKILLKDITEQWEKLFCPR